MSFSPGDPLAHYEILEPIGKGGMGEVYRAKDGKLGREVAIKVLPLELAQDEERLRRFRREAKVLASLNHPNIATIYGLEQSGETHFLVLELVPGETLAERIARGPIPVEEALEIAEKISGALEEAHEHGVVHRDLKPANVKLTEDGKVKVLDFGLAKAFVEEGVEGDAAASMSPTITRDATRAGVILGTAAYMSPEQAKGKRVDRRSDLWAFGAVLYEMLTGKRAFAGEDVAETLAAVIRAAPDFDALPAETPGPVRRVLWLCLTKDPKERARDIGDVRLAMRGAFETEPSTGSSSGRSRPSISMALAVAAAFLLSTVTGLIVWRVTRTADVPRPVARVSIPLPADTSFTEGNRDVLAISPDGSRLVYLSNEQLYVRAMDQMVATPLRGTQGARDPVFSPDSEWIAYWAQGEIKKVRVRDGTPERVCEAEAVFGIRWQEDGTIVFGERGAGILRVSADGDGGGGGGGGVPEVLVSFPGTSEVGHGPQVLPGGKAVLFTHAYGNDWRGARVVAQTFQTQETKVLIERGATARYIDTGHLVYFVDGTLMAVPFDVGELAVTGSAVPIADVSTNGFSMLNAQFSVSESGSLIYRPATDGANRTLVWVDRDGREEEIAAEPRAYYRLSLSPDQSRVALEEIDQNDIWIWDFGRETLTQLTFSPAVDMTPIWTPDGERVAFGSARGGIPNMFWKAADGTGVAERLNENARAQFPTSFTPDGTRLLFSEGVSGDTYDLGTLVLDGSAEPLLASEFDERNAEISPDGRWLAFQSDVSGQDEIYVRPFPNVEEGQWRVSKDGGTQPLWAKDGSELFYIAPGSTLMAVRVETGTGFTFGNPSELFSGYYEGGMGRRYDVSADGERFLMIKEGASRRTEALILVQNWFEELKRLVPADN